MPEGFWLVIGPSAQGRPSKAHGMVALVVNVDGTMGTKKTRARMTTIPTIAALTVRLMPQRAG